MLKKLDFFLNVVIGGFLGVWIGYGLYTYWDYKIHPDLYAMTSFPWYTGIQVMGIFVWVVVAAAAVIKMLIRKKRDNQSG